MRQSELCVFSTDQYVCVHEYVTYTSRSFLTSFVYYREMPDNTSGEPMKGNAVLENLANRPSLGYDKINS